MSQPYLGRCKSCEYTIFAAAEDIVEVPEFSGVKAGGAYRVTTRNAVFSRCDKGHTVFLLKQIKGTYSKDHKCDSRCLNAKGHDCTCSCGGANHGRGHAVTVHEASVAPQAAPKVEKVFLGIEGKKITGKVRVERKRLIYYDATLVLFATLDGSAKLVWFAPSYVEVPFEEGEEYTIRAHVKAHEDHPQYGKQTVVTYVKEAS